MPDQSHSSLPMRSAASRPRACVDERKLPDRGAAPDEAPANALPVSLVHQLIHVVGVPEAEVATMSLDRALTVMNGYWSKPRD